MSSSIPIISEVNVPTAKSATAKEDVGTRTVAATRSASSTLMPQSMMGSFPGAVCKNACHIMRSSLIANSSGTARANLDAHRETLGGYAYPTRA